MFIKLSAKGKKRERERESTFASNEEKFELSTTDTFSSGRAFHRVIISLLPKITDYITQENYLAHLSMVLVQTYTCYHEK